MEKIIIDTAAGNIYTRPSKNITSIDSLLQYYNQVVDKEVTGWIYPIDIIILYAILREAQKEKGDICELGVAFGKSAIGLSLMKNKEDGLRLYDNFAAEITPEQAQAAVKKYGDDTNVVWYIADLMKLHQRDITFKNANRLLHIDACHLHKAVLHDLENFSIDTTREAVIVVDDFNDPEYPGINTAITQFCLSDEGRDWVIFAIGHNKAYLCKSEMLEFYSTFLVRYIQRNFPQIKMTLSEFIDNSMVIINSREEMEPSRILDILEGKIEIVYS
jgi:predicted O-methyltransferase YrrM